MRRRFYPHQKDAFRYTLEFRHPALFMEMRLGKTLVTIRRINLYKPMDSDHGLRILIVAPNSALGSWMDELKLEKESDVALLLGEKKKRVELLRQDCKWNLINKEGYSVIPMIRRINWDAVVIDESTFIRNVHKVKVTNFFLNNFRDCPHRWILTGTPNPESDMEFWSQFAFLDGEAFGSKDFWSFRANNFEPDQYGHIVSPKAGAAKFIERCVGRRAFLQRRKDVGLDKEKIRIKRIVKLPKDLRRQYELMEDDFEFQRADGGYTTTKYSITKHNWLRQLCGGFLDKELVWKGKINSVKELLKTELKRDFVIIWAWYRHEIEALSEAFRAAGIEVSTLMGGMTPKNRLKRVKQFQDGKIRVFIIQPETGKMGMDLSLADTAIYYSEPEGQETSKQTEDRILALSKDGPLQFIYMQVEDSVDQDIREAQCMKSLRTSYTFNQALKQSMLRRIEKRKAA